MKTYALYVAGEDSGLRVQASLPSLGLRLAVEEFGAALASQTGVYGVLRDGREVTARLARPGAEPARPTRWPGVR